LPETFITYEKHGEEARCRVDTDDAEDIIDGIAGIVREVADVTGLPETCILALATVRVVRKEKTT